jgi:hypothetical protein
VRSAKTIRLRKGERGIALLISIFVLLLISVVAIALIISSGTESSLAGNYRSSTGVYYAALSGIEEARGRLAIADPKSLKANIWSPPSNSALFPSSGPLPIGTVGYILNPGPADNAATMLTTYPDPEYNQEFGANPSTVMTTLSIWNRPPMTSNLSFPGPLYKWVRINAVSEKSLNLPDTSPWDGHQDTTPLYYDDHGNLNDTSSGRQVLEITALAVLPNANGQSSQKLVQYLAAPGLLTLPSFLSSAPLAALTVSGSVGNSPTFQPPSSSNTAYAVQGNNACGGSAVPAIGLFGDYSGGDPTIDRNNMIAKIPTNPASIRSNYTGVNAAPDVEYLSSYPTSQQTPAQVDAIAQYIIQNADATFVPAGSAATQTAFLTSLGMSATNPMTVIANGNLDISNWSNDGYGLLLVTGTFTYDPDTTWNGLVLVIGQGIVNNAQNGQFKQINGAMFVAKTRDGSGNLLTGRIGGAFVSFDLNMQGNGIRYSSCWVQNAQPRGVYKILSFHEIAQ